MLEVLKDWDHYRKPFTFLDPQARVLELKRDEKIKAVALGVFVALALALVGGVIAFYLLTAKYKVDHLNAEQKKPNSPDEKPLDEAKEKAPEEAKEKKKKKVGFAAIRRRLFSNSKPPKDVRNLNSDISPVVQSA